MDSDVYKTLYSRPGPEDECRKPYWHCMSYLNEIVVLSDGTVTTCCADNKGINRIGNCNETPLEKLREKLRTDFHRKNIAVSDEGRPWDSILCQWCIQNAAMRRFRAFSDSTDEEIAEFRAPPRDYPTSIVIEPSAVCNYRCSGCPSHSGKMRRHGSLLPYVVLKVLLAAWNDDPDEMEDYQLFARRLGVDFAGWDDIMAEPHNKSSRVAPGTPAYRALRKRKFHLMDYLPCTPAWPTPETKMNIPLLGGLPLDFSGWCDWHSQERIVQPGRKRKSRIKRIFHKIFRRRNG